MARTVIVTSASADQVDQLAKLIAGLRTARIVEPVRVLQFEAFSLGEVASGSDVSPLVFRAPAGRVFPRLESAAHFSQYDVCVWLAPQVEILDRRAFDLLVRGALTQGTAIVPLIHGAYDTFVHPVAHRDALARVWSDLHHPKSYVQFGSQPLPSTAALAFGRGSQVPQACLTLLKRFKQDTSVPTAVMEQIALGAVAKVSKLPMSRLPAWCAWEAALCPPSVLVPGSPVTPFWPSQAISMIHHPEARCVPH